MMPPAHSYRWSMPPCMTVHGSVKYGTEKQKTLISGMRHGQKDRARRAFPGFCDRGLLAANNGRCGSGKDGSALRVPNRFRRTTTENDGAARHHADGAGDR